MSLQHIAIIMDGNGRWAENQGYKRIKGHTKGAEVVRNITTYCAEIGIKYLTLYAFSTENWKRSSEEVAFLMELLATYLKKELKTYMKNNIRFQVIGDLSKFSLSLQKQINKCINETKNNSALTQILALNYGSRDEIIRAIKRIPQDAIASLNEAIFESYLDTQDTPPVDLLIRTSGEERISNFLLWQIAYAEFYFTPVLWPDFTENILEDAISVFNSRERRFGGMHNG
ncbi:MAG: di-trans,poly-cis-decaprenylcistransferase [Fusobacteria bacterium]|nr:di-trans,poly-cis-decaprenylcistransferase [Fusobacteriota bacterium]